MVCLDFSCVEPMLTRVTRRASRGASRTRMSRSVLKAPRFVGAATRDARVGPPTCVWGSISRDPPSLYLRRYIGGFSQEAGRWLYLVGGRRSTVWIARSLESGSRKAPAGMGQAVLQRLGVWRYCSDSDLCRSLYFASIVFSITSVVTSLAISIK